MAPGPVCDSGAKTSFIAPAYGKFESSSLQRRVRCEPDFREYPTKYSLIINLKTAKALGLTPAAAAAPNVIGWRDQRSGERRTVVSAAASRRIGGIRELVVLWSAAECRRPLLLSRVKERSFTDRYAVASRSPPYRHLGSRYWRRPAFGRVTYEVAYLDFVGRDGSPFVVVLNLGNEVFGLLAVR